MKIILSWLLLLPVALGIAAVFMGLPVILGIALIVYIIIWAILAIVEWYHWRAMYGRWGGQ
jgi:membrane protein implicated in regulation of membrane protease activity